MEKYNPSLAVAKVDVVNERIDQHMCQFFHTEVLKKLSQDGQTEGEIHFVHLIKQGVDVVAFKPLEMLLPSALNNLKEQKAFIFQLSDGMGMNIKSSRYFIHDAMDFILLFLYLSQFILRNTNIVLTKKPDAVRSQFNFLQLAHASTVLLAEDAKNVCLENENPQGVRYDKTNRGKPSDRKCIIYIQINIYIIINHLLFRFFAFEYEQKCRASKHIR